jgi:hypothetical protein
VQAEKKENPTAQSSTFHFARASQNKKSLPSPPPPTHNDNFNTHLMSIF